MDKSIVDLISMNESKLLSQDNCRSSEVLRVLLSDDFIEFGASGIVYRKDDALKHLLSRSFVHVKMVDPELKQLSEDVVLLTYTAKKINMKENISSLSLRCSLWRKNQAGWQLVFHQGTRVL